MPLHERLPGFLDSLVAGIHAAKPGVRLWWEPWELSEGQALMAIDRLDPANFGLIIHHTIAEIQFVNATDLSTRNIARRCHRRGLPVIGEAFLGGSDEDISPLPHLPVPRLVHQQLDALRTAVGVVGVKEYYGLVPAHFSVNIKLLAAYLRDPATPLGDLIAAIAAEYGPQAAPILAQAWEAAAAAMELFPWNATWNFRRAFEKPQRLAHLARVPNASWATPAWQANRRGFYMVTDAKEQHPWLIEDVGQRAMLAGEEFGRAATLLEKASSSCATALRDDLHAQQRDLRLARELSAAIGRDLLSAIRKHVS